MGDTGSLALGAFFASNVIILDNVWLLLSIGSIYILETLSVIIQVTYFKWKKRRLFLMTPLHHHFELSGWSEPKIIGRSLIVAVIFALFTLTTLKLR